MNVPAHHLGQYVPSLPVRVQNSLEGVEEVGRRFLRFSEEAPDILGGLVNNKEVRQETVVG